LEAQNEKNTAKKKQPTEQIAHLVFANAQKL